MDQFNLTLVHVTSLTMMIRPIQFTGMICSNKIIGLTAPYASITRHTTRKMTVNILLTRVALEPKFIISRRAMGILALSAFWPAKNFKCCHKMRRTLWFRVFKRLRD